MMFLLSYHAPVLTGFGLVLSLLRAFGIGDRPIIGLLPLSMLLFVGPLAELSVGLLVGRVERRAAWSLLGFLPAFALSIWITTRAWLDGMLGRPYSWVKTSRSGATSTLSPAPVLVGAGGVARRPPGTGTGRNRAATAAAGG